jgi:hypothetical protein
MPDGEVSRNQLDFIGKLREANPEREEILRKFLEEKGKADVSGLTVTEASSLIDAMKKARKPGTGEEGEKWVSIAKDAGKRGLKDRKKLQKSKKIEDAEEEGLSLSLHVITALSPPIHARNVERARPVKI